MSHLKNANFNLLNILYRFFILLVVVFSFDLNAQCLTETHSNLANEGWVTCAIAINPNPARTTGHWIKYDFGQLYTLSDTKVWNSNEATKTNRGFKSVHVDYSVDGVNWIDWGTMEFPEADGTNIYEGFAGPDFNLAEARYVLLSAETNWGDPSCYGLAEVKFNLAPSNYLLVQAKVLIEGAYTGNDLQGNLNSNSLLPASHPFNVAPYNYNQSLPSHSIPIDAVDWVFVEVRDAANETLLMAAKPGFVDQDGNLLDVDGTKGIKFLNLTTGTPYHIIIRHRNHLDIASEQPFNLPLLQPLDFTEGFNVRGGFSQLSHLGNGRYGMRSGDFNGNGIITVDDFNYYSNQISAIGVYNNGDCNFDGNVTVTDFNLYTPNSSAIGVSLVRY